MPMSAGTVTCSPSANTSSVVWMCMASCSVSSIVRPAFSTWAAVFFAAGHSTPPATAAAGPAASSSASEAAQSVRRISGSARRAPGVERAGREAGEC